MLFNAIRLLAGLCLAVLIVWVSSDDVEAHAYTTVATKAIAEPMLQTFCDSYITKYAGIQGTCEVHTDEPWGAPTYAGRTHGHCSTGGSNPSECASCTFTGHASYCVVYFTEASPPPCETGDTQPNSTWAYGANDQNLCDGTCAYSANGVVVCIEEYGTCQGTLTGTGNTCAEQDAIEAAPEGCTVQGETVVCDCVANPGAWYCTGGDNSCYADSNGLVHCGATGTNPDPGGGSGGSGDNNTVPPQDDGNTNQPPLPGQSGDGDVDGDGLRDIDCDPQSNPDCSFTGSGTGSGNCDVQPSCSGDPVQCAQLYQAWAAMCYDGDSFNNPGNCQTAFTCEGDKLKCESIRQARTQYCDIWVGDGTTDMDVTNNPDFARDLRDEGTTVNLPTAFDQSSVGGGDSGSCPDDLVIGLSLGNATVSMQWICAIAPTISILVIISAMIGAAYIVIVGRGKRNSG